MPIKYRNTFIRKVIEKSRVHISVYYMHVSVHYFYHTYTYSAFKNIKKKKRKNICMEIFYIRVPNGVSAFEVI